MQALALNDKYPIDLTSEGAFFEMNGAEFTLIINLHGLDALEVKTLKKSTLKVGLMKQKSAILLVWQFVNRKGRPELSLSSPFDVRLVNNLSWPDLTNKEHRIAINMHGIEANTNTIKALRYLTFSNDFSLQLMSSLQEQFVSNEKSDAELNEMLMKEPADLAQKIKMHFLGK